MKMIAVFFLCLFSHFSIASNKALEIATQIANANKNFKTDVSEMKMTLITGERRVERKLISKTIEINKNDTKGLIEFILPRDIAGTKLLTWSFKDKSDAQWIYLNAFKRVKRISSSSKSSSFMGSEFNYEDLRPAQVDKFTYKFIKEEKKGDDTLWTFEKFPKEDSSYSKQVIVASKKYMNVIKVDFFDKSGNLFKQGEFLKFTEFKQDKRTFWRSSLVTMKNIQTLRRSELEVTSRKLGQKLAERDFSKRNLK